MTKPRAMRAKPKFWIIEIIPPGLKSKPVTGIKTGVLPVGGVTGGMGVGVTGAWQDNGPQDVSTVLPPSSTKVATIEYSPFPCVGKETSTQLSAGMLRMVPDPMEVESTNISQSI